MTASEPAETGPLARKRILVTRARHQAGELSADLIALGAQVIEIPAIEIVPPESFDFMDAALREAGRYQWLILTSANAVRSLRERLAALNIPIEAIAHLKIAAVGAATARAVEEMALSVAVTPPEYVAESLSSELSERARGSRVLIVRAAVARDVIPDAIRASGAEVDVVDAYRSVVPEQSVRLVARLLAEGRLIADAATFTSSSTVTNFFRLLREAGFDGSPRGLRAVSIGPITSQTLRDHGWKPAAEADPHTMAGLVDAVVRALS